MKFFAPIKLSENISKTPEGYLACRNVSIGRVGEMIYGVGETPIPPGPDGRVFVVREADELFRPETIASFEGKPVTILHPDDFVHPQNWSALSKGVVHNVHRGQGEAENDLVADLLITDGRAIALVENGLREVSCGYNADYIETGVGRGVQKNIIGNHLALVEEGRAGSAYAINDHKGKGSKMTVKEKIKAIFAKAQDEAMQAASDEVPKASEEKSGFVTMKDMQGYFDEKFEKLMGGKKEGKDSTEEDPSTGKPAEPVAKDAEEPEGMAAVLKKIEERLSKLEARESAEEEHPVGDEEEEGEEESEDDDFEEGPMAGEKKTGDSATVDESDLDEGVASRAEILAPGLKATKNLKVKALLACYGTKDGKTVIEQFTGGKAPDWKDAKTVDALFVGASEVLKFQRRDQLSGARTRVRDNYLSALETPQGGKTAEEINEINAKHYEGKGK